MGVIALWHAFDDRRLAGRAAGIPGADWRGESADYSLLRGVVEHPASGINADAAKYRSGDAFAAALVDFGFLLLSATLTLMRMRNLILLMEKRRPWVSELILKRGRK